MGSFWERVQIEKRRELRASKHLEVRQRKTSCVSQRDQDRVARLTKANRRKYFQKEGMVNCVTHLLEVQVRRL